MKIKQIFCRHKNIEYKQPIQKYHALNTETVCTEHISNEEFLFRFKIGG